MKSEYNKLYKRYDKAIVRSFKNYDEILEKISEILKNKKEILDFGAGTGELVSKICQKNKNAKITAIDASKNMLDLARKKIWGLGFHEQVNFICDNQIQGNKKYDAVSSTFVLYLTDREVLLRDFSKHLKKDGILVITDVVFENSLQKLISWWVRIFQKMHFLPVANFCHKQELKELIEKHDFIEIHFERTGGFFKLPVYLITAVKKN